MIKVSFSGLDFETNNTVKAFLWLECLERGESVERTSELLELIYQLWLEIDRVDIFELMDFILDNYSTLPDDFREIVQIVLDNDL